MTRISMLWSIAMEESSVTQGFREQWEALQKKNAEEMIVLQQKQEPDLQELC